MADQQQQQRRLLFTEFPPVSYDDWVAQAGAEVSGKKVMWGPHDLPDADSAAGVGAQQPWRQGSAADWEMLEAVPDGLFALPEELGPVGQLQAALASGATAFLVPVDTLYFPEIAKLRALRRLFDQPVRVVAITGRIHHSIYDAHVNLLRATTCAMSAIAGGCDALVVRPFDEARTGGEASELSRRLARNTHHLLREESAFGAEIDPAAGSWYIEALTQQYVNGARSHRVPKEPNPLENRVLVGVTKFPNPAERLGPVDVSEGRIATPWEKLRQAVERSGKVPKVRFALGADKKMSRARLDFARGVFAAGGFVMGDPPDFVVLCAADAEYSSMVMRFAGMPVIVAGPPTLGAFDYVNMKSDLPAKLKRWLNVAGVQVQ
jgi:hypothetical protein